MIVKQNFVRPCFERLSTGSPPRVGGPDRAAASPFASLLSDLTEAGGTKGDLGNPAIALDRNAVQELVRKITERMNSSLLTLVGDEGPVESSVPWFGGTVPRSPVDPAVEKGVSRNRRVPPENDGKARGDDLEGMIAEASKAFGVDRDLIRSVIRVESDFQIRATSPKGAGGLMQLMPDTARELGVTNAFDPRQNIMGGTRYLRKLLDRYHGDVTLALAAYNWGMGNVEANPGRLPRETTNYISRVQKHLAEAKA